MTEAPPQSSPTAREIGAWALFSATRDPAATLALCRKIGVTFLDVMVNDGSTDHLAPVPFHIFDREKLRRAADVWRKGGLAFGLTTWASPRFGWLDGMHEVGLLATEIGARSVTPDLEEPWLVQLRRLTQDERVHATAELLSNIRVTFAGEVGVTHIVSADEAIIDLTLDHADFDAPQCYATKKNARNLTPGELERITFRKWADRKKPIVMGVAGWNQEGAYGLGYLDAFRASLTSARALGSERCRVWRLDAIDQHEAQILREVWLA